MALGDLFQLTQITRIAGDKIVNVFHLVDNGGGGSTPEMDILAGHAAGVIPKWQAAVSEDVVFEQLLCRMVYPDHGPTYMANDSASGSIASDTEVPQSVAVLATYTPLHTKRGRGRMHVSGVPKAAIKDGLLTNAQGALLADIFTPIIAGFGGYRYVVCDPDLGSYAEINYGVVRTHTYTLRSRRVSQS